MSHGKVVRIVTAYGIELMPLKSTSANRGIGIIIPSSKGFLEIISDRRVRSTDRAPRLWLPAARLAPRHFKVIVSASLVRSRVRLDLY